MAPLDDMRQVQATFEAIVQDLRTEYAANLRTLRSEFAAKLAKASRSHHSIPDPEKFDGTTERWDTWYPQIQGKLRIDGRAIGTSEAQFFYVYSNLDSKVQGMVLPQLRQAEETRSWDPRAILADLRRIYHDPLRKPKAQVALQEICQGDDSFVVFHAKFERLLYEAEANRWSDQAKIVLLRVRISPALQEKLKAHTTLPTCYTEFVNTLHTLSHPVISATTVPHNRPVSPPEDTMDLGQVGAVDASTDRPNDDDVKGENTDDNDDDGPAAFL